MKQILSFIAIFFAISSVKSQKLQPVFDINEYRECICIASHFKELQGIDSSYFAPEPQQYHKIYSSPNVGFDNMWELWQNPDGVIAISIRGSVTTMKSWMGNFHAAMMPAIGQFSLGKEYKYTICDNKFAHIHAGWLGGLLSMSEDILTHIDSCYKQGNRDFILTGHSQGGGICFLLTAYLRTMQLKGQLPSDIIFKTYCSAAPKPGDYAFALEYEYLTRGGWAYNVVNMDDWVPEVPLSVQTLKDFNPTNPFFRLEQLTDTMKLFDRVKIKLLFKILSKPLNKSEKKLRKYLGSAVGKMLVKEQSEYKMPQFANSVNYARAGTTIIFKPDSVYHQKHLQNSNDIFEHHSFKSYFELSNLY